MTKNTSLQSSFPAPMRASLLFSVHSNLADCDLQYIADVDSQFIYGFLRSCSNLAVDSICSLMSDLNRFNLGSFDILSIIYIYESTRTNSESVPSITDFVCAVALCLGDGQRKVDSYSRIFSLHLPEEILANR